MRPPWIWRDPCRDSGKRTGGHQVILEPESVNRIDWAGGQVHIDVSRQTVKDGPEYQPGGIIATGLQERPVRLI